MQQVCDEVAKVPFGVLQSGPLVYFWSSFWNSTIPSNSNITIVHNNTTTVETHSPGPEREPSVQPHTDLNEVPLVLRRDKTMPDKKVDQDRC